MEQENGDLLFVYGLLLEGFENEVSELIRSNTEVVDAGYVFGDMYDAGGYPGLIVSDRNTAHKVFGKVLRITKEVASTLAALDYFECIGPHHEPPYQYQREMIKFHGQSSNMDCWVYLYNWSVEGLVQIPSGDFKSYYEEVYR